MLLQWFLLSGERSLDLDCFSYALFMAYGFLICWALEISSFRLIGVPFLFPFLSVFDRWSGEIKEQLSPLVFLFHVHNVSISTVSY